MRSPSCHAAGSGWGFPCDTENASGPDPSSDSQLIRDLGVGFRVTRRAGQKLTSSRITVARVTRKGFRVTRRTRGGTCLLVHRVATAGVGAERFNIL